MKVLLIDMDGVLLEPRAYHRALQETVTLLGCLLGYKAVELTPQDIVAFEAAGVSSEWDSAAICAALLLVKVWSAHPAQTLPAHPVATSQSTHDISPPDFQAFARRLAQTDLQAMPPLRRTERLLLHGANSRTQEQRMVIQSMLGAARQITGSLTHRIFQELVLGSRVFAETYNLSPSLDAESYLLQYDRATLSHRERASLLGWLADADHRAVIFTSRPSRPPGGHFGTPEAEIGARGIGLQSLPILGFGGLSWLSAQRDGDPESLLKPSPVHALAALRLAIGDPPEDALKAAAALALDNQVDRTWGLLGGAQVFVFEDTISGLKSVCAAKRILDHFQVPISVVLFGITDSEPKQRSLEAVGAVVTTSLFRALESVPGF